jgi:hypothetical protein
MPKKKKDTSVSFNTWAKFGEIGVSKWISQLILTTWEVEIWKIAILDQPRCRKLWRPHLKQSAGCAGACLSSQLGV